jgi:hypothetical protein
MLRRGLPCAYSRYDVSDGLARTPLDPIEVTPINISAARKWLTARFAVEALDILEHEEVFRTRCLAPPPEVTTWRNGKAVDTWYSRHHLPDLLKHGVIERMQERPPISCGYFAVEKRRRPREPYSMAYPSARSAGCRPPSTYRSQLTVWSFTGRGKVARMSQPWISAIGFISCR